MEQDLSNLDNIIAQQHQSQQEIVRNLRNLFKNVKDAQDNLAADINELRRREIDISTLEQTIKLQADERTKELDAREKNIEYITSKLQKTTTIGGKNQKIRLSVGGAIFVTTL